MDDPLIDREKNMRILDRLEEFTRLKKRLSVPVPEHGRFLPYILGAMTFLGFLILIGTGMLIAQFYNPASPKAAYESVSYLQNSGLGYLRSLHSWTASATVLMLSLHLMRVYFTGAYKSPRQLTWWIGVGLFAAMVYGSFFSGTVLKWDDEGGDAAEHYTATLQMLGPIGNLLIGDNQGHTPLSVRLYSSHISLFPLLTGFLLLGHFYLIRMLNLAPTPWSPYAKEADVPVDAMRGSFYDHVLAAIRYGVLYFGGVAVLALVLPAPLGPSSLTAHSETKPPVFFLWIYALENFIGVGAILYASLLLFLFLFIAPLIDLGRDRTLSQRRKMVWTGGVGLIAILSLTAYAWIAPAQSHMGHHHHEGDGDSEDHENDHEDTDHHDHENAEKAHPGDDGTRHQEGAGTHKESPMQMPMPGSH